MGVLVGCVCVLGGVAVYVFSNHIGCDGERVYYDSCSMMAVNGDIVSQGEQFSLKEVVSYTK